MTTRNRLSIDLGDQHDAWINLCKKLKQRPSTLAREVLLNVMICEESANTSITADLHKISHADKTEVIKQKISLRPDEAAALDRYAETMGVKRHDALVMIIREFVANEPQFTFDEIDALCRSNRNMRKCAANLNEMAKKINSLAKDGVYYNDIKTLIESVRRECRELKNKILSHSEAVYDLIYAGKYRIPVEVKRNQNIDTQINNGVFLWNK